MERLILQYPVGDGYTWSADITVPVFFESKEAFELYLLEAIEEYAKKMQATVAARADMEEAIKPVRQQLQAIGKKKHSRKEALEQQYAELLRKRAEMENPESVLQIGSHELNLGEFVEMRSDGEYRAHVPTVYTLDEFFAQAG